MKVLLVDDHAVVRQGYASLLRALLPEVQLREACDGEQALQRVQEEIPNLVIMDIGLPGISGLETTRRLRQRLPVQRQHGQQLMGGRMLQHQRQQGVAGLFGFCGPSGIVVLQGGAHDLVGSGWRGGHGAGRWLFSQRRVRR